ncbi:hypothetical protein STSP2_03510 [Anaerohalosphaera lusitana]|uniref:DUF4239 domain-containing protein n=1 Tax=Anaerohalosphaera lusitana TaxID=1936003 RepID=A0A1U9NRE1_9BACT|nr:hypothetical protein [Anaerohalosphaera lusitana]AQT70304.1 hypothetical protein STSP2_03510 [Anaerohalosphaera lusitana]
MEKVSFLDYLSLPWLFAATFILVLLALSTGVFWGRFKAKRPEHEPDSSVGPAVGATLAMVGFLIAFAFALSNERLETRKQLLLDEVNAIGTAYLRTHLLEDPYGREIKKLLEKYVDIRTLVADEAVRADPEKMKQLIARSEQLQDLMWLQTKKMVEADNKSPVEAVFISSLNELFDLHTSRVVVTRYRFQAIVWYIIYVAMILSMLAVGYQMGLSGRGSTLIVIAVALTFSAILLLVVDLDRTSTGTMVVNQGPMLELQKTMQLKE